MRARLCYAAPGHSLLSTAGSTRNILATAAALAEWVDVTVAFRDFGEAPAAADYRTIAIEPSDVPATSARDDVAARGLNPLHHGRFLKMLRHFVADSAGQYDLVLEKGWRLSGYLAREFSRRGTPAVLIENDARCWNEPRRDLRSWARFAAHLASQRIAGRCSRSLPLVIAETEDLKAALIAERRLEAERVKVVALGVDHGLFRPQSREAARADLGFAQDASIMLYVGGMDQYHDLSPLLKAIREVTPPRLEVHLVGDGTYSARYRELANGSKVPVRFHGQVGHAAVPNYIAASDVCLAPYQTSGFHGGQVCFSTLKIPEYMACERPVISVPSGNILRLIDDGVSGFLFPNEQAAWQEFLTNLPDQSRLAEMGRAAAPRVASLSWSATAQAYLRSCRAAIGGQRL